MDENENQLATTLSPLLAKISAAGKLIATQNSLAASILTNLNALNFSSVELANVVDLLNEMIEKKRKASIEFEKHLNDYQELASNTQDELKIILEDAANNPAAYEVFVQEIRSKNDKLNTAFSNIERKRSDIDQLEKLIELLCHLTLNRQNEISSSQNEALSLAGRTSSIQQSAITIMDNAISALPSITSFIIILSRKFFNKCADEIKCDIHAATELLSIDRTKSIEMALLAKFKAEILRRSVYQRNTIYSAMRATIFIASLTVLLFFVHANKIGLIDNDLLSILNSAGIVFTIITGIFFIIGFLPTEKYAVFNAIEKDISAIERAATDT